MNKHNSSVFSNLFSFLIIILIIVFGLTFSITSFFPFESVKAKLGYFAPDGTFETFKENMLFRARIIGFILISLGLILVIIRKKFKVYTHSVITSFIHFFKNSGQKIRKIIKEDRINIYFLLGIIIISIIPRLFFLNQPIRHDEAVTFLTFAREPLIKSLSDYSTSNNHLLHTLLLHISYLIFGNELWAIRLPALIGGILIVPATYFAARMFYNKNAAILASGIVASSSYLIEYSTNARGYTLLCLFFLLILILATYLKHNNNTAGWVLFSIFSALGFYTIPIFLYSFGVIITWLLLSIIFKDTTYKKIFLLKNLFIAIVNTIILTFLLYIPAIIFRTSESGIIKDAIKSQSLIDFFRTLPHWLSSTWSRWNRDIPFILSIVLIVGFFVSIFFNKKLKGPKVPIILAVIIWLTPLLILQRPVMYERLWLFLLLLYIILASTGIAFLIDIILNKIKKYKIIIIPILAIILSLGLGFNTVQSRSVYYSNETGTLQDAEDITLFLKDYLEPKDRIILQCPSEWPLPYYFDKYGITLDYFHANLEKSNRAIVIINKSNNQTLETILDWSGLSLEKFEKLELLKNYESANVYITYKDRGIKNFIIPFYEHFLDRKPSSNELNKWVNKLKSNDKTTAELAEEIFFSNEFINRKISDQEFVTILYKALLQREPDKEGYEVWLNNLEQGKSRQLLLRKFINSQEFKDLCDIYGVKPGELLY